MARGAETGVDHFNTQVELGAAAESHVVLHPMLHINLFVDVGTSLVVDPACFQVDRSMSDHLPRLRLDLPYTEVALVVSTLLVAVEGGEVLEVGEYIREIVGNARY